MSNVVEGDFLINERMIIPTEKMFDGAKKELNENHPIIVVGIDKEGFLRVASTRGSVADTVLLLERAKAELVR